MKTILITLAILIVLALGILGALWWADIGPFTRVLPTTAQNPSPEAATPQVSVNPTEDKVSSEVTIEISNFAFRPGTTTVKKGTTVTWANKDSIGHNAAADDASWKTAILSSGQSVSVTFDKAGTYPYHCTPHPFMKGTIVVVD